MRSEAKSPGELPAAAGEASTYKQRLSKALAGLGQAVAAGKSSGIRGAYQALRAVTGAMPADKRFQFASQALGTPVRSRVASAYAHRSCFMCIDGTLPCETCEATGQFEPGRKCPNCDGMGLAPCEFCRGTNWADRQTIPHELRQEVLLQQMDCLRGDLQRLKRKMSEFQSAAIRWLPAADRRRLIAWLVRLQSRLHDLLAQGADDEEKIRLAAQGRDVAACIAALRDAPAARRLDKQNA